MTAIHERAWQRSGSFDVIMKLSLTASFATQLWVQALLAHTHRALTAHMHVVVSQLLFPANASMFVFQCHSGPEKHYIKNDLSYDRLPSR